MNECDPMRIGIKINEIQENPTYNHIGIELKYEHERVTKMTLLVKLTHDLITKQPYLQLSCVQLG